MGTKESLTIEQLEGAIICTQDQLRSLKRQLEIYEEGLKWRKRFEDKPSPSAGEKKQ